MALSAKQTRMLDILSRRAAWVTAAELADELGVSSRSIRSYAAAIGELSSRSSHYSCIAASSGGERRLTIGSAQPLRRHRWRGSRWCSRPGRRAAGAPATPRDGSGPQP